jgi:hypothetical protein
MLAYMCVVSHIGDRDSRLTAGEMRALCRGLCLKLKLSCAYHPQTDGQTEQFNSTLLQMLRCFVGKYHTDWPQHIPALLYAYHNTVHSATGFTPHQLLFGWSPQDLRAPLSCPDAKTSGDRDIEQWLRDRKSELKKAQLSMEAARQAMIRARKAAPYPTVYKKGDKVKVSTSSLPVRCASTTSEKLQPKYIGPFTVLDVQGKVLRLQMPRAYSQVHDKFNVEQVRPWLHSGDNVIDPDLPEIAPHPSLNPVVQVLDRKKIGRPPKRIASHLDIPAQYLVVHKDGSMEWVRGSHLKTGVEKRLVKDFEFRFKRTDKLPCNPVKDYPVRLAEEDARSDDELDIGHYQDIQDHYGSDSD